MIKVALKPQHRRPEQVRQAFAGQSVWFKSADNLTQLRDRHFVALQEKVAGLPGNQDITRVIASQKFIARVQEGKIDLSKVSQTDIRACVKPRAIFSGQVLDLDNLQQVKRSPLMVLKTITVDILMLAFPKLARRFTQKKYDFAFCVHPRKFKDVVNGFPLIKIVPNIFGLRKALLKRLPPFRLSEITLATGETGILMCVGWDRSMFAESEEKHEKQTKKGKVAEESLNQAQKKMIQMARLAKNWGVEYIGLGALHPRYSNYGQIYRAQGQEDLKDITITTGHAYTVVVISQMVAKLRSRILAVREKKQGKRKIEEPVVAVVGAAGSTGACSARKAALDGAKKILLVDTEKETKVARLDDLKKELEKAHPGIEVGIATQMKALKTADVVVVVSSAPGVIIESEHLKDGCFVVDDTQPVNVCPQIVEQRAGKVQVFKVLAPLEGINPDFRFDRHTPLTDYVFTCMADVVMRMRAGHRVDTTGAVELSAVVEVEQVANDNKIPVFGENDFFSLNQQPVTVEEIDEIANLAA